MPTMALQQIAVFLYLQNTVLARSFFVQLEKLRATYFQRTLSLMKISTMKNFSSVLIAILLATAVQAQVQNVTAEYQKMMQPALQVDIPYPEKTVMNALVEKLEKLGYKGKETKGFYTFKGVRLPELGSEAYDLYFKTERKSRREKDATLLTMLISSGYEKFLGSTDSIVEKAKIFLVNQIPQAEAYDLEMQITEQDNVQKKADKRLKDLVEDNESLVKRKEKLEQEIADNLKKQEEQRAEIEKQTQIGNTLKGKRKTGTAPASKTN
jgi:hypothetical protein